MSDFPEFDKAYDAVLLPDDADVFNYIAADTRFNIYNSPIWRVQGRKFVEAIVRECADRCGSQADQRNLLTSFGFEAESNVKYPAPERHWSIKSQYDREYNLPKGVTNEPKN
jgi:hypothetical protein